MSFLDSLAAGLNAMGFAQMGCVHAALLAYIVALNSSLPARWRSAASVVAIACVATFAALAPSWPGGIALAGLGVVGCAIFTAMAWGLAALLGLDARSRRQRVVPPTEDAGPSTVASPATA